MIPQAGILLLYHLVNKIYIIQRTVCLKKHFLQTKFRLRFVPALCQITVELTAKELLSQTKSLFRTEHFNGYNFPYEMYSSVESVISMLWCSQHKHPDLRL